MKSNVWKKPKIQVWKSTQFIRAKNFAFIEGLNGLDRQPSRTALKLTVSRQKSSFFTVNCQTCNLRLTVKSFKVFQISLFQLIFTVLVPEECHVLKITFSRHYSTLKSAYIWKISKFCASASAMPRQPLKHNGQWLIEVNMYFDFWTKFPSESSKI